MTEIKLPFAGRPYPNQFVTVSSSGFPSVANIQTGATLHFVDTGEEYVLYNGMWEPDLRRAKALEMQNGA